MVFVPGKRYLFMGQRYAFSGTVDTVTPTHVVLGADAQVHYEDIGEFDSWSLDKGKPGKSVPGQIVSVLGTDATPILGIIK